MVDLGQTHPDDRDQALVSRALMFCPLPFRKTLEKQVVRVCRVPGGKMEVIFNALDDKIPLPFGDDAFVLDVLTHRARWRKDPEITTEHLADLMRLLGYPPLGGHNIRIFLERIRRIGAFAMRVKRRGSLALNARLVDADGSGFWSAGDVGREGRGARPLPYVIRLSPEYFADIMSNYCRMPMEVLGVFSGSPTEYSLVKWLWVQSEVRSTTTLVPWDELVAERGSRDSNVQRFKGQVRTVLKKLAPAKPEVARLFKVRPRGLSITPLDALSCGPQGDK